MPYISIFKETITGIFDKIHEKNPRKKSKRKEEDNSKGTLEKDPGRITGKTQKNLGTVPDETLRFLNKILLQ